MALYKASACQAGLPHSGLSRLSALGCFVRHHVALLSGPGSAVVGKQQLFLWIQCGFRISLAAQFLGHRLHQMACLHHRKSWQEAWAQVRRDDSRKRPSQPPVHSHGQHAFSSGLQLELIPCSPVLGFASSHHSVEAGHASEWLALAVRQFLRWDVLQKCHLCFHVPQLGLHPRGAGISACERPVPKSLLPGHFEQAEC